MTADGTAAASREPVEQRVAAPARDVDDAVDPGDNIPLERPDGAEHPAVPTDLALVHPLVGLRDPEVHGQDDPLVRAARARRAARADRRALGVDDAVAEPAEGAAQRRRRNTSCQWRYHQKLAAPLTGWSRNRTPKTGAISGPAPGEGRHQRRRAPFASRYRDQLAEVRVDTGDACLPERGGDDQGRRGMAARRTSDSAGKGFVVPHDERERDAGRRLIPVPSRERLPHGGGRRVRGCRATPCRLAAVGTIGAPLVLPEGARARPAALLGRAQMHSAPARAARSRPPSSPGSAGCPGSRRRTGGTAVDVLGPAVVLEERDLGRDLPARWRCRSGPPYSAKTPLAPQAGQAAVGAAGDVLPGRSGSGCRVTRTFCVCHMQPSQ